MHCVDVSLVYYKSWISQLVDAHNDDKWHNDNAKNNDIIFCNFIHLLGMILKKKMLNDRQLLVHVNLFVMSTINKFF